MTSFLSGKLVVPKAQPPCKTNKRPLALLRSFVKVHLRLHLQRPWAKGLLMAGMISAGGGLLALPVHAEKIPYNNSYFATSWCTAYPWFPFSNDCASIIGTGPSRPFKAFLVFVDWGFGPDDPVSARMHFDFDFDYDPTQLAFNPDLTSLVCDLRAGSATPYCPNLGPGQGTMPLELISDDFTVDQTGLTITEDATGRPSVSIRYAAAAPITLRERNFLALAFDLLKPMPPGSTVTYSPTLLADASLSTTVFHCLDENDVNLDKCESNHPSMSLRLNAAPAPVPGPLAVSGLPVMLHASRRLRRRVQRAGR
jgi:hypothetical protein